ncbi:MAG: hypothetical protein AAF715_22225 [Myxococcota bacterium]
MTTSHGVSRCFRMVGAGRFGVGCLALGLALSAFMYAGEASAQDSAQEGRKPKGVITLAEITITGRIQKPIAAVDVARIRPRLTLSELRRPFLERITEAIYTSPF